LSKRRKRREAIQLVFENVDNAPFFIEMTDWKNGVFGTTRRYRIGVQNVFDETVDHVRVIVEAFDRIGEGVGAAAKFATEKPMLARPERRLRLSLDQKDSTSVLSARSSRSPVMFDFVEEWLSGDATHSDWAWLCFADEHHEAVLVFGKCHIVVRAEGDGCDPVRMTFLAQNRTYRGDTLADHREVTLTKLIVRKHANAEGLVS
jgi:hypothetical protein